MSERPDRSDSGYWACFVQSINGLIALALFALALLFSGAFSFQREPFSIERAMRGSSVILLPVIAVITSVILLWLRNKWGWYLTLLTNLILEWGMGNQLFRSLVTERRSPASRNLHQGDFFLVLANLLLVAPIFLLVLPESRREYLTSIPSEESVVP